MTIYTKKGDTGTTSTVTGDKISKSSQLLELQGSVDEVNAGIGYLISICCETMIGKEIKHVVDMLRDIQHALFRIGTDVSSNFTKDLLEENEIVLLEKEIDLMESKTGSLTNFIHYSGTRASTYTHVVRSVTRRTERVFAGLLKEKIPNDYKYLNRLADYFFALARYLNHLEEIDDEILKLR
ncbi:MAG: ATP:cob(I)alamin adenosyltransferase [Clostridiales bacterium 38_11]|nr:MAG: ATP:cob(I)alamin adenosyltransferase [Clostridiales bacterium 38_11]HBH13692.1 cob(I)yrinic acid a,c-diamide adenosyltransferase [Clostridiales bacterium]